MNKGITVVIDIGISVGVEQMKTKKINPAVSRGFAIILHKNQVTKKQPFAHKADFHRYYRVQTNRAAKCTIATLDTDKYKLLCMTVS